MTCCCCNNEVHSRLLNDLTSTAGVFANTDTAKTRFFADISSFAEHTHLRKTLFYARRESAHFNTTHFAVRALQPKLSRQNWELLSNTCCLANVCENNHE